MSRMSIVRASKFRHIFGTPAKGDQCFNDVRVTRSAWDSNFCAVNPKFMALAIEGGGGGPFLVLRLDETGRVSKTHPILDGHSAPVLDLSWSPFNDNIIATCSEDCTIKIWLIPDEGIKETTREAQLTLTGHQRRVLIVSWHPTAENVLLSVGADNMIVLWDVGNGCALSEIACHPDNPLSVSWNYDGSLLATTCKDKALRIIDPRSGDVIQQRNAAHDGTKTCKCVFLKDGRLMTFGFSRMSDRQYALWDSADLSEPIIMEDIDRASGVLFPFYDPDTEIIYVAGKGDANIRYFEITQDAPYVHYINTFQSQLSQRGFGYMPKRGCDVNKNEVVRFFKLHATKVEPISFTVPRKSELFQADIFPPTFSNEPSLSCESWLEGNNADPIKMDLSQFHTGGSDKNKFGGSKSFGGTGIGSKFGAQRGGASPVVSNGNAAGDNGNKTLAQTKKEKGQARDQHAFDLRDKIQAGHVSSSPFMSQKTTASGMAVQNDEGVVTNNNLYTEDDSTPNTALHKDVYNVGDTQNNNNNKQPSSSDVKRASSVGQANAPTLATVLPGMPEGFNLQELLDDIKKMKATIKKQGRRIAHLEAKLGIEK